MVKLTLASLSLAVIVGTTSAFTPVVTLPSASLTKLNAEDTRRSFFGQIAGSAAAISAASTFAFPIEPALAFGGKVNKINARLASYGLPQMGEIASGYTALLEVWGKGKNRNPLLVNFAYPIDWVVTLPSQDINGEDGTIQAGEYARGDTATFYVSDEAGKVENINEQPKAFFEKILIKSISQKGDNMYQNFKVTKIVPKTAEYKGQQYMVCDFKYQLLTGAGFEIDRIGVAAVTSAGGATQVLWSASTALRYKKTEIQLRSIVDSFRCYADGLDLSMEKVVEVVNEY
eukprot:CAMPEP_0197836560 /NCGR_PEP_ID=MMETSP1437-20131217/29357_1 /TAXON_ID=49252 ORGANISM="Eucampia antarctica, Strain CCMP1452" /NCGR_SAMPLE_ID=MMETSP1437 /ASSEMBLY_ACC=CAM_ASM_001096 /LENGTH=287 /DNA_ID=CAMNT_0043442833 /DNA_START=11 /DNA_END=874 /DNA_ORIENTATION=-